MAKQVEDVVTDDRVESLKTVKFGGYDKASVDYYIDLAMTGEITLRGRVLPIGGLKEKLLAAKYARIKEVLVPEKNRPDIEEMDREIIQGLNIRFVDSMKEVLGEALA